MSYISQYEKDMDYAYDQIQKATANPWNLSEYKIIQALNVVMRLVGSTYEIVAEIGDKLNGESE